MGRPPLNYTLISVRLPQEVLDRLDKTVGKYGRAKFIREAVEAALAKRET